MRFVMVTGLFALFIALIAAGSPTKPSPAAPSTRFRQGNQWTVQTFRGTAGTIRILNGFESAVGLSVGSDGTLYVMDGVRGQVVRFSKDFTYRGWLGMLDGNPHGWHDGGVPAKGAAEGALEYPHALAMGVKGTLFIPDHRNGRINRYAADGKFLGLFRSATKTTVDLVEPVHVHVDAAKNLWVSDYGAHRIVKYNSGGGFLGWKGKIAGGNVVATFATQGTAEASDARGGFRQPHMVATDRHGNVYVADTGNHRIQKFSAKGAFLGWIGARADGSVTDGWSTKGSSAESAKPGGFRRPNAVTIGGGAKAAEDMLIITDADNHRIVRFNAASGRFMGWTGGKPDGTVTAGWEMKGEARTGSAPGAFASPFHAEIFGNALYVADSGNRRVQVIDLSK